MGSLYQKCFSIKNLITLNIWFSLYLTNIPDLCQNNRPKECIYISAHSRVCVCIYIYVCGLSYIYYQVYQHTTTYILHGTNRKQNCDTLKDDANFDVGAKCSWGFSIVDFLLFCKLYIYIYIYIYIYTHTEYQKYVLTSSLAKWVECSPIVWETWVQSQVASYQRLLKWHLIPPCLTLSKFFSTYNVWKHVRYSVLISHQLGG